MKELPLNNFIPKKTYTKDDFDRVILLLCKKGAMFPSEIARNSELEIDQVNLILRKAMSKKLIVKIVPDRLYPQNLIKCRIAEIWALGIEGYESFAARSWYALSEDGVFWVMKNYSGKHMQIENSYILEYELEK